MPDTMNMLSTFLLADNQDITCAGLHSYLADLFHTVRIQRITDKKALTLALAEAAGEAVVVLDYTLFDLNGADELLIIARRFPDAHWLLFSNELSEDFVRRLSGEPNISMALKENTGEEIRSALLCSARGKRFLCHQLTNLLLSRSARPEPASPLTATKKDILRLIARGKTVKEIAAERVSSIHTIVTHKKNIFRKLQVNNVYEATKYALRAGLMEMSDYYI